MKCNKCGATIKDGVKFCPYCGAKQEVTGERSDAREEMTMEETSVEQDEPVEETSAEPVMNTEEVESKDPEEHPEETEKSEALGEDASVLEADNAAGSEMEKPEDPQEQEAPFIQTDVQEKAKKHFVSFRQLKVYLSDPASAAKLDVVPAVTVLIVSCLVNMWLVYSVLASILRTLLKPMASYLGTSMNIGSYMSQFGYGYSTFFINGLMMTAVIYAFLLVVTFFSKEDRTDLKTIFTEAAGYMAIPTVMMFISCILLQFSLDFGLLMFVAAIAAYLVILLTRLRSDMNIYVKILIVTVFLLLLVMILGSAVSLNTLVRF